MVACTSVIMSRDPERGPWSDPKTILPQSKDGVCPLVHLVHAHAVNAAPPRCPQRGHAEPARSTQAPALW